VSSLIGGFLTFGLSTRTPVSRAATVMHRRQSWSGRCPCHQRSRTPAASSGEVIVRRVKGFLIDGPAAGSVIETGDPPARRGILVMSEDGFAEDAYRYYLSSIDAGVASYTFGGKVEWPPEAGSQMIGTLVDRREPVSDLPAPRVRLNGD